MIQGLDESLAVSPIDLVDRQAVATKIRGVVAHHALPLLLRDRVLAHPKAARQFHAVAAAFHDESPRLCEGAAHQELAWRNPDHAQRNAAAQVQRPRIARLGRLLGGAGGELLPAAAAHAIAMTSATACW